MTRLTPKLLLGAYASGIFPMAESRHDRGLFWVDPDVRGVLPFEAFHIPRRLRRTLRRRPYQIRCDAAFDDVLVGCAEVTSDRPETWINQEIEGLYRALFDMGFAHTVECWEDGELVGGLYGVSLGAAFFGESMFSRARDASKVALCHLVARLERGGYRLLDTQFVTDHLRQFGAVEIARSKYRDMLANAMRHQATFHPEFSAEAFAAFLHSKTQMS